MIVVDTKVISETLSPAFNSLVIEWLIARDAELVILRVTLATRKVDDFRHFGNDLVNHRQMAAVQER